METRGRWRLTSHYKIHRAAHGKGYVYLIYWPALNIYKIGHSAKLKDRLSDLRREFDSSLVVLAAREFEDRLSEERRLHAEYAPLRRFREWFELDTADVASLAGRLSTPAPQP